MREGDIEAIRSRMKEEGRPLKSTVIRDGGRVIVYDVNSKGRVNVKEDFRQDRTER